MTNILTLIKKLSVWQQLLICLAAVSLFFSLLFGYTLRQIEREFLLSNIKKTNQQTVALITATSADAIITEDRPLLESVIIDVSKSDPAIIAIRIANESGRPLAQWRSATVTDATPITISEKIVVGNEEFGSVVLDWDSQSIESLAQAHSANFSYLYALSLLVFSVTILGVLSLVIVRPLVKIRSHIGAIGSGNLADSIDLATNREIKALSESLNMLTSMLKNKQDNESLHRQLLVREHELQLVAENRAKENALGALQKAESANRVKSAFLTNMSHELRTPLNAIIGYGEILEEDAVASGNLSARADLQKILGAGRHLLSLINDVLDLSKVEAGNMQLELETFDLGALISESLLMVGPLLKRGGNRLQTNLSVDGLMMYSDPMRIRQVLFNLLSNACKFTQNGIITVSAKSDEAAHQQRVMLSVRDTGPGVAPEDLARLFQPFVQAESVGHRQEGAGLGLALCHRFCELMGGEIHATSVRGQGAELAFWLPITALVKPAQQRAPIQRKH
jgi:signal transduction histidine kinase